MTTARDRELEVFDHDLIDLRNRFNGPEGRTLSRLFMTLLQQNDQLRAEIQELREAVSILEGSR